MKKIKVYDWINLTMPCLLLLLILSTACGQSVETNPKVAVHQPPAFAGQTRVKAVKTGATFKVSILTKNLSRPWGLDFLPDGRMVVSELQGTIRIVSKDGTVGNALKGVPSVRVFGVSGMMDVKVSPNFKTSRYVFWTYPEPVGGNHVEGHLGIRIVVHEDDVALAALTHHAFEVFHRSNRARGIVRVVEIQQARAREHVGGNLVEFHEEPGARGDCYGHF